MQTVYLLCALAGVAYFVYVIRQPVHVCGGTCTAPEAPTVPTIGNDRYVVCETCPLRHLCTDEQDVKPCGRTKAEVPHAPHED